MNAKLCPKLNDTQVEAATPARASPPGNADTTAAMSRLSKRGSPRLVANHGYGGTNEGIARAAREPPMVFAVTDATVRT